MGRTATLASLVALLWGAPPAVGADFRIFTDDGAGLGVIDLDAVTVKNGLQAFDLALIYPDDDGGPVQAAVMPMQLSCDRRAFRATGPARGLDAQLAVRETHDLRRDWQALDGSPLASVASQICDGRPLPRATGDSLREVVERRLARPAAPR